MSAISRLLGIFFKLIYDGLAAIFPTEPAQFSVFAMSIIVTTIIIKVIVLPLNFATVKNQRKMAKLQPEIQKLQKKYKNDPQTLAMKQQQLYKDSNTNMLAGCLPMIVQLVVLMAFYQVFLRPEVYAFTEPGVYENINKTMFGYDLGVVHNQDLILPLIAGITTFLVSWIGMKNPASQGAGADQAKGMMTGMMVIMPIMIFSMSRRFQSGLVLYWIISNLFAVVQQIITNHILAKEVEETE